MKTEPSKITKTAFKKWLRKQPDTRIFRFLDCEGCLIATFYKEALKERVSVTGYEVRLKESKAGMVPIPGWLNEGNLVYSACGDITILKKALL